VSGLAARPFSPAECAAEAAKAWESGDKESAESFASKALEGCLDEQAVRLAAWVLSGLGRVTQAAAAYRQVARKIGLSADEYAFLGNEAAANGELTQALEDFAAAADLDSRFVSDKARALNMLGRHADAAAVIVGAPAARQSARLAREMATAATGLGRLRLSVIAARRAVKIGPEDADNWFGLASAQLGDKEAAHARATLDAALARLPELSGSPFFNYLCSIVEAELGNSEKALLAIDRALSLEAPNPGFERHRASLLASVGRYEEAASVFRLLLTDSAGDPGLLEAAFATFTEAGWHREASEVGAALLSRRPDDERVLLALHHVLSRRIEFGSRGHSNPEFALARARRTERSNPAADRHAWLLQARTLYALILREAATKFGKSRLGYFWVVFEPVAHIGIMLVLISALNFGSLPPIGQSFAVFYYSGIIPYHMFTHTAGQLMSAVPENKPLLYIPRVKIFDVFLARGILEFVTELLVALLFLVCFTVAGVQAAPLNWAGAVFALLLIWLAAFGTGLLNAVISNRVRGWERIWGAVTALLYFSSGTFYIPRMMPIWLRDILAWNPILQGIELLRVNYFHEPKPHWLSPIYLICWAVLAPAFGLAAVMLSRRRLLEVE